MTRLHTGLLGLGAAVALGLVTTASAQLSGTAEPPAPSAPPPWSGDEAGVSISWPSPPSPAAPQMNVRWIIQPDSAQMRLNGEGVAEGFDGKLSPGQSLEVEGDGAQVLLLWTLPDEGYELHQLLEAPCRITVQADGTPDIEGLGWAHLFRSLAEALSPFGLSYQSVDTGFESTEIAVALRKEEPWIAVIEGSVIVGERLTEVSAGQWTAVNPRTRRARGAPSSTLEAAVKKGTLAEVTLLPETPGCPAKAAEAVFGAPLISKICFDDKTQRDGQLKASRQRALIEHIDEGGAQAALGDVYLSAGAFTEAAHSYRLALFNNAAGSGRIARELGNARWALGDAQGARDAYRQATTFSPGDGAAWFNRALAAGALGDEDEAIEALKTATEKDATLGAAQTLYGQIQLANGEAQAAATALLAARDAGVAQTPAFMSQLSSALRQAGMEAQAVEVGQARVKGSPDDIEAWLDLARSLYAAGKQGEALRAYERALEIEMEAVKDGGM